MQMRTTLTLDDDVAAELEKRRRERGTTLKREVNELLRLGLRGEGGSAEPRRAFRTEPHDGGRLLLGGLDDVAEALAAAEGDGHA